MDVLLAQYMTMLLLLQPRLLMRAMLDVPISPAASDPWRVSQQEDLMAGSMCPAAVAIPTMMTSSMHGKQPADSRC